LRLPLPRVPHGQTDISRQQLEEKENQRETMISWDGFEDAIIGTITPFNGQETLCYRYRSMIDVLVSRDGMTEEEAEEYLDYNIIGAWVGETTPFVLFDATDTATDASATD
jgi:hypothetical protein